MNRSHKCLEVDSPDIPFPNIPLVTQPKNPDLLFGEFIPFKPAAADAVLGPVKSFDMFLPNFTLRLFEGKIQRNTVFCNHQGQGMDMLGSCMFFKGQIRTFLPGVNNGIVSRDHSQNFNYDPDNEFRHLCLADTDLKFIHISFTPDFLNQFLPEDEAWAEKLRVKINKKERIVGDHVATISLAQEHALSNIFNTNLKGKLRYMMIETSIIQVILLQLHLLFHKEETCTEHPISKRDLEIIRELKDFLSKSFLEDHTITGLAQRFGINTNKLMNLFRKIFGKSIFEFITDQRMNYARKLLSEEGYLVTEASRNVGYKNPNHFSSAFKKRFGVNPSVLKN